jgi:hypothetical protein
MPDKGLRFVYSFMYKVFRVESKPLFFPPLLGLRTLGGGFFLSSNLLSNLKLSSHVNRKHLTARTNLWANSVLC